jgi:tetratricopeptide (TPR) repeat protein
MKRHNLVAGGTLLRLMQAAHQAYAQRDFETCFETMERARRMAPADTTILLDIGGYHARRYDITKATEYFDRAIKLSPGKTAVLEDAGTRCRDATAFLLARTYLEQAAARSDVTAEGLAALGWVYERLRQMDEANAVAERAIQKNPNSTAAILIKARLEHLSGKNAEAEARLRAFTTGREHVNARVRAAYDLGAILDRQGRYDEAMAAFQHAKDIQKPNAIRPAAELKITRERLKALYDGLTPEILKRWQDELSSLAPTRRIALLGGHPRSGTTLLEQVVDTHSEIVSAEETDIFSDDAFAQLTRQQPKEAPMLEALERTSRETLAQLRNQYWQRTELFLGQPVGSRLLVDKNPSLTFSVPAMARIFPEVKFLIALRDPRDVCMSCFMQPVLMNQVSSAWLSMEGTINEYVALMGGWRQTMPKLPQPTLEVRYEDMVTDLEPVARKTLEFLGVAWDPKVLGFDEHARQKAVRSPTYSDVTKKVFKTAVGRWRNYQKYFEPHLAKLEPLVKALGYE